MATRGTPSGAGYWARLGEAYAGHARGTIGAADLPRAPQLPSRL